jgi:hypothetical protein
VKEVVVSFKTQMTLGRYGHEFLVKMPSSLRWLFAFSPAVVLIGFCRTHSDWYLDANDVRDKLPVDTICGRAVKPITRDSMIVGFSFL